MSYQEYVAFLIDYGFSSTSIIDLAGNARASSEGFALKEGEGEAIAKLFEGSNVKTVTVAAVEYTIKGNTNKRTIYAESGATKVALFNTTKSILIGVQNDPDTSEYAITFFEGTGDQLTELGL